MYPNKQQNRQALPSGEIRTFEPDAENVWKLTEHTLPQGIDYGGSLIGTPIEEMPAPAQVNNEQHS